MLEAGLIYPNEANGLNSKAWEGFANAALSTLCAKELEASSAKEGIEWREFKLGELFEVSTPKKKFNANELRFNGKYPYVARGDSNNGIRGYIDKDEAFLNEANTISFGQDTATIFYQTSPYFTGDKIKIFTFKKGNLDRYKANFLIAVMKRAFSSFSWGSSSFNVGVLKNVCVLLPILNSGTINFTFMETFIKAIEKQHIEKIYAFWETKLKAYDAVINGGGG
nr:restriction endonuclease subunit S [Campylobacter helveticus]